MLADVSISSAIVNSLKKEKRIFISFYVQYTSPAEFWHFFLQYLKRKHIYGLMSKVSQDLIKKCFCENV